MCIPAQKDFVYLSYTSNLRGTPIKALDHCWLKTLDERYILLPQAEDEKMRRVKREGLPSRRADRVTIPVLPFYGVLADNLGQNHPFPVTLA